MLTELSAACEEGGLQINLSIIKYITNLVLGTNLNGKDFEIELVEKYVYLGSEIKIGKDKSEELC